MKPIVRAGRMKPVHSDIRGPLFVEAMKRQKQGIDILKLNTGNPATFGFGLPDSIKNALLEHMQDGVGYCDFKGMPQARQAICDYETSKGIKGITPDDVFIGNGVSEVVSFALTPLLNDGDEVLVPSPSYSLWGNSVYLEGGKPVFYTCDEQANWYPDIQDIRSKITDKTCAIIMETVQGEGGIYPAAREFIQGVRKLCDEKDILLILDEIQCGMGRTGHYFAWQAYGVQPDIMTSAKALGCGVPVGAFVLSEKAAKASLEPGDHGTTYGGNPFVCAAVSKVFDIFEQDNILAHVQELTPYLEEKLDALVDKCPIVVARRGKGFMQGLVIEGTTVGSVVTKALANGLLVISAGSDVLRLVPPLVITKEHIDEMIEKLEKSLA